VDFGWNGGVIAGFFVSVMLFSAFVGELRQASAVFRAAVVSLGRFDGRRAVAIDAAHWHPRRSPMCDRVAAGPQWPSREHLLSACDSVTSLWNSRATIEERKQITRLLLHRIDVHVLNNSERVSVRLHWSGGFESCHDIARPVSQFCQLESYEDLIERTLSLSLQGHSNPEIAVILAKERYVSPRSLEPVSRFMVQKLLESPRCAKQLHDPELSRNHWRANDLAKEVGIPEKRLKDWVTHDVRRSAEQAEHNEVHPVRESRFAASTLRLPSHVRAMRQQVDWMDPLPCIAVEPGRRHTDLLLGNEFQQPAKSRSRGFAAAADSKVFINDDDSLLRPSKGQKAFGESILSRGGFLMISQLLTSGLRIGAMW